MGQNNFDSKKYIIVFFITVFLFITASYLSNYFNNKKIGELKTIQDKISIDILSSETQFSLLSELSCKNISTSSVFSNELGDLGRKLEWGQDNLNNKEELTYLRKYYSILQIKDYLLMKKITARCNTPSAFILYFYTTLENCSECEKQSLVLSKLRDLYPELKVYSFDYSIDLSAVKSIINIYKIKDTQLPALVVGDEVFTGFKDRDELESILKANFKLKLKIEEDAKKS